MDVGKIFGMVILIVVIGYGIYTYSELFPELESLSQINEKQKEDQVRISYQLEDQVPNCYYDLQQKVTICD